MTKNYTGPVYRALLEPNNNEGCIMRAAPLTGRYYDQKVKMDNLSVPVTRLFGCLAMSPFADLIFDAGRMEDRPLGAKKRYDQNYDYEQVAVRRVAPFDSEVMEDGSIEVSGELEILINSAQSRRNDPFPNGMEIANRSASNVGREKVDSIVWDYAERFRFRSIYEMLEHLSDIDGDVNDWEDLHGNEQIDREYLPDQLTHTRRFGTTSPGRPDSAVDGFRRTLHEPSSVAIMLQAILHHDMYNAIRPRYNITHSVTDCLMQMTAQNHTSDCIISYISMALMPSKLPIPNGPFEGLEVMDPIDFIKTSEMAPSFTATRKRIAPDMSHWIKLGHSGPGTTLDVQFSKRGPTFNFNEENIKSENLVSLTDKDDSLLGFARINERGHAFLCIPFDLEFTVSSRLINIRKGDYRIGMLDEGSRFRVPTNTSLWTIHSLIIQALESIRFNPVSDRVKSISRIINSTDDKTSISHTKIDHRLSRKTSSLTDDDILGSRNID